ncbi:fibronectin type III domain-containing protein [Candidatus Poriferisocius sp.]|uniref:fibronectin type III domain-containing protein n=1 Tax=Candidatus Poriferisocius sp. TaxID=3101276 RepID=UPI003B58B7B7
MAAFKKWGARRSLAVLVPVLLLATGLVLIAADNTPTAEAHEVCKGSPFGPLCGWAHTHPTPNPPNPNLPCGGSNNCPTSTPAPTPNPPNPNLPCGGSNNCPTPTPAPTPKPCSFLSHRHGSTGACHWTLKPCNGSYIDHDATCTPPKPDPTPTPKPDPTPTPKPCSKHTHGLASHCTTFDHTTAEPACTSSNGGQQVTWVTAHYEQQSKTCPVVCAKHTHGLASHCTTFDHTTAEPACTSSNGGQQVTWITAHYNQQSKTCPTVQTDCKAGDGKHRHASTNTCHADHFTCDSGKYKDQSGTVFGHLSGTDNHGQVSARGCHDRPTTTPGQICSAGQQAFATPPTSDPIINYYTNEPISPSDPGYDYKVRSYGYGGEWEQVSGRPTCYNAVISGGSGKGISFSDILDGAKDGAVSVGGTVVSVGGDSLNWAYNHWPVGIPGSPVVMPAASYVALAREADKRIHAVVCYNDWTQIVTPAVLLEGAREGYKYYRGAAASGGTAAAGASVAVVSGKVIVATAVAAGVAGGVYSYCQYYTPAQDSAQDSVRGSAQDSAQDSVPVPASGLRVSAEDGGIAVSWTASATTPDAGFGYRVQWKLTSQTWDEAAAQHQDLEHAFAHHAVALVIADLVNGSAYDVRVAAYNENGLSTWIDGQATPTAPAPDPASGLSLAAGDGEIAVSWTASATTPAAGFGYRVQWKLASQTWDQAAAAAQTEDLDHGSDLATSYTVTGLSNGSAYDVRVAAFNADGVSAWISGQATPAAPAYKAPASLVATVRGYAAETQHGQDHVDRWNGALEGLCVEDFPGVAAMTSAQAQGHADTYSSSRWSPVVAELKKAEAANCTITAKPEPKATAPDPASGLSLAAGDKQIAVSWSASATAPAAGFGYRVQWKLTTQTWGDAAAGSVDLDHGSDLATSHTITGLVNGSAYDVRVAAFNANGVSDWITAQATPTAPAVSAPDPASGLSLSAGDKQIAVSWSASATAPAAGFGYRVQWKLVAQAWGDAAVGSEDLDHGSDLATSHTITGLANGSAYDVRVAAFNADGVSAWITGQTTPTAPKPKPKPSLAFDSVSCESSGSGWVITATWSKTPETLKPDIWANEAKNRGHRARQTAVAGTSTTFDVPNAGWYQVGMQAKLAGNKKVGDNEAVRCR